MHYTAIHCSASHTTAHCSLPIQPIRVLPGSHSFTIPPPGSHRLYPTAWIPTPHYPTLQDLPSNVRLIDMGAPGGIAALFAREMSAVLGLSPMNASTISTRMRYVASSDDLGEVSQM